MADHYEDDRMRRGLAVLVEDAPIAPDFEALTTTRVRPVRTRRSKPLAVAGLSAAAVLATFVAGAIWVGQSGPAADPPMVPNTTAPVVSSPTPTTGSTLAALEPGEFPRVLIAAPGWTVTYIQHSDGTNSIGEFALSDIQFSDGSSEAELRMASGLPHADLDFLVADRLESGDQLDDAPIWDTVATVVKTGSSAFVAMWESNAVEYELVMGDTDETIFRALLGTLTQTAEEEWIAALPDTIVTDRAAAASEFLADIPVPLGFDVAPLGEGPVEHWYQVGADVVSSVTCAWIDQWVEAKAADDQVALEEAVGAMGTSREWGILHEMTTEGEFAKVVWEYADAMAGEGVIVTGEITTVDATYERAFGCGS